VLLVFQNTPAIRLNVPGVDMGGFEVDDPPSTKFDLTLFLYDGSSSIQGAVHYNADIFANSSIHRFVERYQRILAEFAGHPSSRLSELLMDSQQVAEAAAGFSAALGD